MMIGRIDPSLGEVTIVGAGVAGMLLAHRLDSEGHRVRLLEAAPRGGGIISTARAPFGIAESGPHSFLASPEVRTFCAELGVELVPVNANSRARYVYRDGRLRKMPLAPHQLLTAFARAYFVLSDAKVERDALTLEHWGRRHLGQAFVDRLLNPMVRGIYAARPSELSVAAAFPDLLVPPGQSLLSWAFARKVTRRKQFAAPAKGPRTMMAPRHGMGDLVGRLEARLVERLGDRFERGRAVEELPLAPNLVLCVPAYEAARLLRHESPELGFALSQVRYAPMVSATAFVPAASVPDRVRGVGVLVPEGEPGRRALGILFNSSSFEGRVGDPAAHASFTVMLGGTSDPDILESSDEELQGIVSEELREMLGVSQDPVGIELRRWQRAIPIYDSSIATLAAVAGRSWCAEPGRALFGNYTGQVSLRGMIETASRLSRKPE